MLAKRIFDLVFTIPGVALLLPLFVLISLWIKADNFGPVFFRQDRVGINGKIFSIYKFRTMIVNAEKQGKQITVGHDWRITRAGRFLRKYKLDELPQLFNVLLGHMSLVGPRPEVPRYVAYYPANVRENVLSVPPGLTDYASIEYKDENKLLVSVKDPEQVYIKEILPVKLAHSVRYIKDRSIWLDFKLIIKTLIAIISRTETGNTGQYKSERRKVVKL